MREHNIGKVENGSLITPTEREYKGIVIANPTDSQLKFLRGYTDIDKEQIASIGVPEYDEKTQALCEVYFVNEETGKINKRYDVIELAELTSEETEEG